MSDEGDEASEQAAFTKTLVTLKRQGCNLLVVGRCGIDAHDEACRRLLGGTGELRRRLLVMIGGRRPPDRLPGRSDPPDRFRLIEHHVPTRGAAAVTSGSTGDPFSAGETPSQLADETIEAIEAFETAGDGLEPAELRLCIRSLSPLIAEYPLEEIESFLDRVTDRVDRANGMGHYHVGEDRGSELIERLAPQFDAVIEVRADRAEPDHRWHLQDEGISSDWLPL